MNNTQPVTVFIDRDGTMGGTHTVEYPQDYEAYPFTYDAIARLHGAGLRVMVITNQSCIARGKDGGYDFGAEFAAMGCDDWFIGPHDNDDHCACRKPEPGLLLQARDKYGMDLTRCYMVGDRWSDMAAGGAVGARLVLVLTGRGHEALTTDRDKWAAYTPAYVAETLGEAADWIAARETNR